MITKKLGLAAAISSLVISCNAFAGNVDNDGDGLFETASAPNGATTNFDGALLFGGSDNWSWTVFGPGAVSDSRMVQVAGLAVGETTLDFVWTTGGGTEVNAMYASGVPGWEAPVALDPLFAQPFVPPVIGGIVTVNGNVVAEGEVFTLTGVSNGSVITINTSYTGTANGDQASGVIHGVIGEVAAVPVPAAAWLFGSAMLGLAGIGRKRAAA